MKHFPFARVATTLCALFYVLLVQLLPAQNVDLRGVSAESRQKQVDLAFMPNDRWIAAKEAYDHATAESLAALPNNSTKLRDMYALYALNYIDNRPNQSLLTQDMKRRGEGAIEILVDLFKRPVSEGTRINILKGLLPNPWIDSERFLPLVRDWYDEMKKFPPKESNPSANRAKFAMTCFIAWAGHPEDEAMMRDLVGPDGQESADMKDFLKYAYTRTSQKGLQEPPSAPASQPQNPQPVRVTTKNSESQSTENNVVYLGLIFVAGIISLLGAYIVLRRKNKK